jgi:hypothetical protein
MMPADTSSPGAEQEPVVSLVRSYTITAGRTRPAVDLPLEARLQRDVAEPDGDAPRDLVLRAADGRSVAEVSAEVRMPVGVVRVLLGAGASASARPPSSVRSRRSRRSGRRRW